MIQENSEEISLKILLIKLGSFFRYILSKWLILLVVGVIGAAIGFFIAYNTKPIYIGKLTFVLSTETKGGALSGLASQFGLDMGGSSGNDVFAGDNILTLFKSKKMIKAVLFKKPPGSNDILANIIVKDWQWEKKWKKKARTKDQFPFPSDVVNLNPVQDSLLREVHAELISKDLTVARPDKKLSVFEVSTTSTSEIFACYLTRFLMDETAEFYIDTKTSIAKRNLRMLQREADSLRGALGGAISSTAAEADRTFALNPALQVQKAPAQKSQVRATILATAYGEVIKNLEIAKITVQKETPLYQILDVPEMPLKQKRASKLFYGLIGGMISFFITIIFLLIRRFLRK
ncbi:MAG: hypothetical protein WKF85_01165 [Chitinophagaceae bacterium]